MTENQVMKKTAQAIISDALKIFRGSGWFVKQNKKSVCSDSYDKLSREQLDQGVVALVLECNLSGGSVIDMDLYKLIRTYLWSPEARTEINGVVKYHGL